MTSVQNTEYVIYYNEALERIVTFTRHHKLAPVNE